MLQTAPMEWADLKPQRMRTYIASMISCTIQILLQYDLLNKRSSAAPASLFFLMCSKESRSLNSLKESWAFCSQTLKASIAISLSSLGGPSHTRTLCAWLYRRPINVTWWFLSAVPSCSIDSWRLHRTRWTQRASHHPRQILGLVKTHSPYCTLSACAL